MLHWSSWKWRWFLFHFIHSEETSNSYIFIHLYLLECFWDFSFRVVNWSGWRALNFEAVKIRVTQSRKQRVREVPKTFKRQPTRWAFRWFNIENERINVHGWHNKRYILMKILMLLEVTKNIIEQVNLWEMSKIWHEWKLFVLNQLVNWNTYTTINRSTLIIGIIALDFTPRPSIVAYPVTYDAFGLKLRTAL